VALQTSLPTQVITTAFGGSYGVNEVNDIVGDVVSDGITKAFVYAGGTLAVLSNSNLLTRAHDVNDAGTVVGIFVRGGSFHAFSWSAGLLTELSELGGGASEAYAINAAGVIAGSMAVGGSEMRATLWTNGVPLVIDTLGGDKGQALAITDENLVTGSAVTAAGEAHAFLWSPSTGMVDIHTIGDSSGGRGVNAYGQVVGEYSLGGARRGFVYTCGQMYDLTSLIAPASGWTIETAAAINDDGMIVCLATQGGPSSGLLLIPRA
jgi:probable HAF family extracellular repeat protein